MKNSIPGKLKKFLKIWTRTQSRTCPSVLHGAKGYLDVSDVYRFWPKNVGIRISIFVPIFLNRRFLAFLVYRRIFSVAHEKTLIFHLEFISTTTMVQQNPSVIHLTAFIIISARRRRRRPRSSFAYCAWMHIWSPTILEPIIRDMDWRSAIGKRTHRIKSKYEAPLCCYVDPNFFGAIFFCQVDEMNCVIDAGIDAGIKRDRT